MTKTIVFPDSGMRTKIDFLVEMMDVLADKINTVINNQNATIEAAFAVRRRQETEKRRLSGDKRCLPKRKLKRKPVAKKKRK